jgi:hypothetical protein
MHGFLLGFSNGTACLASCVPVLVSLVLAEGKGTRASGSLLALFLGGRLAGYLVFAIIAWSAGRLLPAPSAWTKAGEGAAFVLLGGFLAIQGFRRPIALCAARIPGSWPRRPGGVDRSRAGPPLLPVVFGLLTGINLCPPFLLALADAAAARAGLGESVLFFLAFFCGTSLFFLPLPLLGGLHRRGEIRIVGRLVSVLLGLWYCRSGLFMLLSHRT